MSEVDHLRDTARAMARKLAWWTSYVNRTGASEDAVADSANDLGHAYAVLRGLGVSEADIEQLSTAKY